MSLSQYLLKHYVVAYEPSLPKTFELEQMIGIGTGFHQKWYRSQKDHWLGWLVVQDCQARRAGKDPTGISAKPVWQRLNCSPMMFWLAEAAGVEPDRLDLAAEAAMKAAGVNPMDGPPHGRLLRSALPWELVEKAVLSGRTSMDQLATEAAAREAFERLVAKNSSCRLLLDWLQVG